MNLILTSWFSTYFKWTLVKNGNDETKQHLLSLPNK